MKELSKLEMQKTECPTVYFSYSVADKLEVFTQILTHSQELYTICKEFTTANLKSFWGLTGILTINSPHFHILILRTLEVVFQGPDKWFLRNTGITIVSVSYLANPIRNKTIHLYTENA